MIEIIVRGPGGCIDVEAEVVRRALVAAGFTVSVENNHPTDQATLDRIMDKHEHSTLTRWPIKLKVDHMAWGG